MTPRQVVAVPPSAAGMRLDLFLTQYLESAAQTSASRAAVQKLIANGVVRLNRQRVKPSARLRESDLVQIENAEPSESTLLAQALPLDIIYEDPEVVVVNKAAGMVVHPAAGRKQGTLVNALLHHCPSLQAIAGERRPGIVHRLDKDTSGVMVVAKTAAAVDQLARQFHDRTVAKEYLALVWGAVPGERGQIDRAIGRHRSDRKKMSSLHAVPHKRTAITEWQVEARLNMDQAGAVTLLRLKPRTGRTHQLRVHMADMRFPLVGDAIYGGKAFQTKNEKLSETHGFTRQALHAESLGFDHPRTKERMMFVGRVPSDMRDLLATLGFCLKP